jgi:hypothetical protein
MLRVLFDKFLVSLANRLETLMDAPVQVRWLCSGPIGGERIVVLNPLVHLGLGSVVIL